MVVQGLLSKNKFIVIALIGLVVLTAVGFMRGGHQGKTVSVKKGSIIESTYGIGTVTANKRFQIKLGVTSTITEVFVKEGDRVKAGDKLITLDGNTAFTAPFDGFVVSLPFKIGETVFPQLVLLDFLDLADRYVLVSLEQRAALRVSKGLKAKLSFDGLREQSFEGIVDSVYSNGADFLVRINAEGLPPAILPGMTADVAIGISVHDNVLLVPIIAIENNKVYRKNDASRPVEIKAGLIDTEMAEILSGDIKENDELTVRKRERK